jgi:bifunctional UDP-N-acetylglucosamine pyrophosphorylase/glucosamine-1-phosphate N-acetyltransferase
MTTDLSVVILAAGKGTRMKSARPKVLHPLCGRPMLAWVVELAASLAPQRIVLVVGEEQEEVERAARAAAGGVPLSSVVQQKTLGTGHAVQVAAEALGEPRGRVLVLYGDMPLLRRPRKRAPGGEDARS